MIERWDEVLVIAKKVLAREAKAIYQMIDLVGQNFLQAVDLIRKSSGKVVVIGIGKSGHIGKKIAASMASLGTPAFFVHAAEAVHGDLGMIGPEDVVILISHSGETSEVLALLDPLRQLGTKCIAITSRPDSSLAKACDVTLITGVTEEADTLKLAPTASSTATLALGDALAVALSSVKGFSRGDFARLHPGGALGKALAPEIPKKEKEHPAKS